MAVIFRDKFSPKFQQEFSRKFQQGFLPKFQNFGSNLNKIFYKILVNLNILPIIFAVVLLSLLQYYNKNPVRNLVSISAILLLKYCYTFSYRLSPFYIQDLAKEKVSHYDFRNKQAEITQVNSKRYDMKSFRFKAAQVWNSLSNEIRLAENYKQFKRLLQVWDGVNCRCTSCSC